MMSLSSILTKKSTTYSGIILPVYTLVLLWANAGHAQKIDPDGDSYKRLNVGIVIGLVQSAVGIEPDFQAISGLGPFSAVGINWKEGFQAGVQLGYKIGKKRSWNLAGQLLWTSFASTVYYNWYDRPATRIDLKTRALSIPLMVQKYFTFKEIHMIYLSLGICTMNNFSSDEHAQFDRNAERISTRSLYHQWTGGVGYMRRMDFGNIGIELRGNAGNNVLIQKREYFYSMTLNHINPNFLSLNLILQR